MPRTPGNGAIRQSGYGGILPNGKLAVFDASGGACDCCEGSCELQNYSWVPQTITVPDGLPIPAQSSHSDSFEWGLTGVIPPLNYVRANNMWGWGTYWQDRLPIIGTGSEGLNGWPVDKLSFKSYNEMLPLGTGIPVLNPVGGVVWQYPISLWIGLTSSYMLYRHSFTVGPVFDTRNGLQLTLPRSFSTSATLSGLLPIASSPRPQDAQGYNVIGNGGSPGNPPTGLNVDSARIYRIVHGPFTQTGWQIEILQEDDLGNVLRCEVNDHIFFELQSTVTIIDQITYHQEDLMRIMIQRNGQTIVFREKIGAQFNSISVDPTGGTQIRLDPSGVCRWCYAIGGIRAGTIPDPSNLRDSRQSFDDWNSFIPGGPLVPPPPPPPPPPPQPEPGWYCVRVTQFEPLGCIYYDDRPTGLVYEIHGGPYPTQQGCELNCGDAQLPLVQITPPPPPTGSVGGNTPSLP